MYQISLTKHLCLFFIIIFIAACHSKEGYQEDGNYIFYFRTDKNSDEFAANLKSLTDEDIDFDKNAVKLDNGIYYDLYYHNGVFYDIDTPTKIRKIHIRSKEVYPTDSCKLTMMSEIETHTYLYQDQLLIIGLDTIGRNPVYGLIDLSNMTTIKEGTIDIPDEGGYERTSIGFAIVEDKKLYITYVYHNMFKTGYTTHPFISMITLNYPEMTMINNSVNHKTTYSPRHNRHQPTIAQNREREAYFITNAAAGYGAMPEMSSGILRLDKENNQIDENFFINTTELLNGVTPVGIWYISDNNFLIKAEKSTTVKKWSDFLDKNIYCYFCIDTKTLEIKKIQLPDDMAWYTDNVIIEDNKAYIANYNDNHYSIWSYEPSNDKLKKETTINSAVKRIFSINHAK